jgi:plasmid stabilization system protein ParE
MKFEVRYTERARAHLEEIVDWIAERSPQSASRWIGDLEKAVEGLRDNPERFGFAPERISHQIEIHQMHFGKRRGQYRVLFTVGESRVVILDVRHSMRPWLEPGELDDEA